VTGRFAARAAAVADVAARFADEVDRDERPPVEAVTAMKEQRLLSLSVPAEYGGEGASMLELSEVATTIGAADANAGMVFAMHHSQALPLWRHGSRAGVRATIGKVVSENAASAATPGTRPARWSTRRPAASASSRMRRSSPTGGSPTRSSSPDGPT
jgi:acyl-CoA dehydrogenase